jgi:hypothetical protein
MSEPATDLVRNPPHYKGSHFESINIIEAYRLGFHLGNAFKYMARHKKKGGLQDIEKAHWYLGRYLDCDSSMKAQSYAWMSALSLGFSGIEIEDIVLDFNMGVYVIEQAAIWLLIAASSDGFDSGACIRRARDLLGGYIESCKP